MQPGVAAAAESRAGWCLKKGKTDKPWGRAHHSHRYFVSRGPALCYFERPSKDAGSSTGGERLLGVIDLRQVLRVRPSADPTAPNHAIDIVTRTRTYTLSPQPATADVTLGWAAHWAASTPDIIDPELLHPRPPEADAAALDAPCLDSPANGDSGGAKVRRRSAVGPSGDGTSCEPASDQLRLPPVVMGGFLLKLPVQHPQASGGAAPTPGLLGGLAQLGSWRRRYFVLREGLLQWYKDDPATPKGEELGAIQITGDGSVEYLERDSRLCLRVGGVTLMLRDGGGQLLGHWEQALREQLGRLRARHDETERREGSITDLGTV